MIRKYAVAVYDPLAEEWNTYCIETLESEANRIAANVQLVSGYPARVEPCYFNLGKPLKRAA
jgi:hypothetical protein